MVALWGGHSAENAGKVQARGHLKQLVYLASQACIYAYQQQQQRSRIPASGETAYGVLGLRISTAI